MKIVATTSFASTAVYRPNDTARATTDGTPPARAKIWPIAPPMIKDSETPVWLGLKLALEGPFLVHESPGGSSQPLYGSSVTKTVFRLNNNSCKKVINSLRDDQNS